MGLDIEVIKQDILNHKKLDDYVIRHICDGDVFPIVDTISEDVGRWDTCISVIFQIDDSYYSVYFFKGLTELQEDFYISQTALKAVPKTVETIDWEIEDEV